MRPAKIITGVILIVILLAIAVWFFSSGRVPVTENNGNATTTNTVSYDLSPGRAVIGKSVQGREIEAYTFGSGSEKLLLVGGIHGGYEWNTILLAYQFIDYLEQNKSTLPKDLTVTVVPSANPDGLFKVIGKEGRFLASDAPAVEATVPGRFNANSVDLNRNFNCHWQPESTWRSQAVSAGTSPFSEPEAIAVRNLILKMKPKAVVFWHSQGNAVYGSKCDNPIAQETINIMNTYAKASGYNTQEIFDSYDITGDAEGWLASINVPALTVELSTHETIEFEKNLAGIKALFDYYKPKN